MIDYYRELNKIAEKYMGKRKGYDYRREIKHLVQERMLEQLAEQLKQAKRKQEEP